MAVLGRYVSYARLATVIPSILTHHCLLSGIPLHIDLSSNFLSSKDMSEKCQAGPCFTIANGTSRRTQDLKIMPTLTWRPNEIK